MNFSFVTTQSQMMHYYIPFVDYIRKIGDKSTIKFLINPKNGHNNITIFKDELESLSKLYNFTIVDSMFQIQENLQNLSTWKFCIDDRGIELLTGHHIKNKIALTHMSDYRKYSSYYDYVDHIILNSPYFSLKYAKHNNKNRYFGATKYDWNFTTSEIKNKFNIPKLAPTVLVLSPLKRDADVFDFSSIIKILKGMGFFVILKSRTKDFIFEFSESLIDLQLGDCQLFPHVTSELMNAVDLVINCSSSAIEEIIMYERPVINIDVKPYEKHFSELYNYRFCHNYEMTYKCPKCKFVFAKPQRNQLSSLIIDKDYICPFCKYAEHIHRFQNISINPESFAHHVTNMMDGNFDSEFSKAKSKFFICEENSDASTTSASEKLYKFLVQK